MTMPSCACSVKSLTRCSTASWNPATSRVRMSSTLKFAAVKSRALFSAFWTVLDADTKSNTIVNRVGDVIVKRRAGVNDVAVGRDGVAVNRRIQRSAGGQFLAAQFLFRRGRIPAGGGIDLLNFRDGNFDHFVNRIRIRPVPGPN
jgi:hypothetical protein